MDRIRRGTDICGVAAAPECACNPVMSECASRPHALDEFVRRLPKTETHLHREGALPYRLLQQLDPVRFAQPPPSWAPEYCFGSFTEFDNLIIGLLSPWFTSAGRYHAAAAEV